MESAANYINDLIDKALLALQKGRTQEALGLITSALSQKERVKNLHYTHALCLLQTGRIAEGKQALREELGLFPGDPDAESLLQFVSKEERKEKGAPAQISVSELSAPETQPIIKDELGLPIHFFTIVLNGMPFMRHHIEIFKRLPCLWHWHVMEGVADLKHCTSWSLQHGGGISSEIHKDGLSVDGTTEYLDELKQRYPDQITIYRKPHGTFWDGKIEMVSAPLANIKEECLLWEIDSDELWLSEQIARTRELFQSDPTKTAAYYFCHYFVGDRLVITSRDTYGNHSGYEWMRTWRYKPGDTWVSHEPPCLARQFPDGNWYDLYKVNPFVHAETEREGLIFQHFAYVTREQLRFKEIYYGYAGAVDSWRKLQDLENFPVLLRNYFTWVTDNSTANTARFIGVRPIAKKNVRGEWTFHIDKVPSDTPAEVVYIRADSIGDAVLSNPLLPFIRDKYPHSSITVVCQQHLAEIYEACPYVDKVIPYQTDAALLNQAYLNHLIAKLQNLQVEVVLSPVYSPTLLTHILVLATRSREKIALRGDYSNISKEEQEGYNILRSYSRLIDTRAHVPEIEHNRDFLKGLIGTEVPAFQPKIWTLPEDEAFADQFFEQERLNPEETLILFAAAQQDFKASYAYGPALAPICAERGFSIVALGGESHFAVNQQNGVLSGANFVNMCGKTTLRQCAAIIRKCRLAIGADTSHAHIACAVGTRNVVLIGGGHFGRFFPYSPLTSLVCLPLDCYGCNWRCKYPSHYCIKDIHSHTIHKAILEALDLPSELPRIYTQTWAGSGQNSTYPQASEIRKYLSECTAEIIEVEPVS